jgi:hypothetical protein
MSKIYVVTLRWVKTPQNVEAIDAALGNVGDWIRFNAWTWFIATNRSPVEINSAIFPKITTEDSVLIVDCSADYLGGWAPKWIWDWFQSRRAQ